MFKQLTIILKKITYMDYFLSGNSYMDILQKF